MDYRLLLKSKPLIVVRTGILNLLTASKNSLLALDNLTPLPAKITGRSDLSNISI